MFCSVVDNIITNIIVCSDEFAASRGYMKLPDGKNIGDRYSEMPGDNYDTFLEGLMEGYQHG